DEPGLAEIIVAEGSGDHGRALGVHTVYKQVAGVDGGIGLVPQGDDRRGAAGGVLEPHIVAGDKVGGNVDIFFSTDFAVYDHAAPIIVAAFHGGVKAQHLVGDTVGLVEGRGI